MSVNELFEVDELQQLAGFGLKICDGLEIRQPTVGDIIKLGESQYFSMIHTLTAIPSDVKAQLDDHGLDWEKVNDFELFAMLSLSLPIEQTEVLFGSSLDFRKFRIVPLEGERQFYLMNDETGVKIDEIRYKAITNYLCKLHGFKKVPQFAGNAATHKMLLEMAREDLAIQRSKKKEKSMLRPLVSTMINMPGFKYNLEEVMHIGFAQFMDAVQRVQVIASTTALQQGVYSGMVDTKKINKDQFNFMRDL